MTDSMQRLEQLIGFLESDSDNPTLLADAADAAISANDLPLAASLLKRLERQDAAHLDLLPMTALLAMRERRFADAARHYGQITQTNIAPAIRFNRAWALAMVGDKDTSLSLLDDECCAEIAAAAMLRVQIMHERGDFEDAINYARQMIDRHGDDPGFAAAVSVLAIDIEDIALALRCAERGDGHPDALSTLGVLNLDNGDIDAAHAQFDAAIAVRDHHPRAWIGRGLARLARHDSAAAAADIDRGAEQFGDHIGSWIAAGWAHFVAGDVATARERFERALSIDENFGETHGSLGVMDVVAGDRDQARRRIAIARRLDKESFSAMLAASLLATDDPAASQAIVEKALTTPINDRGRTLAGYMAGLTPPTRH